jgi:hypothetical protein
MIVGESLQAFICAAHRLSQICSQLAAALDDQPLIETLNVCYPEVQQSNCLNETISRQPAYSLEFDQFVPDDNNAAQLDAFPSFIFLPGIRIYQ